MTNNYNNNLLLKALRKEPVPRPPVWLMRQAGRYLPEYRAVRAKVKNFLELCQTPELACEVTLQPITRFGFDAAIVFSDILVVPLAMGQNVTFIDQEGPVITNPINNAQDIQQLLPIDATQQLAYVLQTIKLVKNQLNNTIPLIGFAGSPWTLATYMVEGSGSKQFSKIKAMLYAAPQLLHQLLQKITDAVINYVQAQVNAGVDVIMLFDTWGNILAYDKYPEFSLQYMQQVINAINVPNILFMKHGTAQLQNFANSGCTAVGLDWTVDLAQAKKLIGKQVVLQGNLDPSLLSATPQVIQQEVAKLLAVYKNEPGYIFNLGHGILPEIPISGVESMLDTIYNYKH